jgi:Protein of unknown function (DUF4231)
VVVIDAPADGRSAYDECVVAIQRFKAEADKSQRLAWAGSLWIVLSSAAIPVLIVIATQTGAFVLGQLLPAVLAALAAVAAGAAQIVRPHERWRSSRQHQILLERERSSYVHRLGAYATEDRDRTLLERVMGRNQAALDEWQTFVPATSPQVGRDASSQP